MCIRDSLWPLPECFSDGRGTGRPAGQLSYGMGPVHRKAARVHGFYRQAVSEPCRHHPVSYTHLDVYKRQVLGAHSARNFCTFHGFYADTVYESASP